MKILVISNLYPPDALGGYEMGCRQVVETCGPVAMTFAS